MLAGIVITIIGAVVGSFAGVIAERLHTGQSWVSGRSRCNSCNRALGVRDLLPVLSWFFMQGRCRGCGATVPFQYVLIEASLAALFLLSYLKLGLSVSLVVFLCTLLVLAVIVLYDLRHTIVPPEASSLLIVLAIFFAFGVAPDLTAFGHALFVAGAIALGFLLMYLLSRGRAMGLGDAPVAFALSLLAAPYALSGLLFSFWIGALVGIAILVRRPKGHRMNVEVPFVPFMAAGFLLAFFTAWNPLVLSLGS